MKFYCIRWFDALQGWRLRWAETQSGAQRVAYEVATQKHVSKLPTIETIELHPSRFAVVDWLNRNHTSGNA